MLIDAFLKLRPFAYHTTSLLNREHIRRTRTIESTRRLFELAECATDPRLRERRSAGVPLAIDGAQVSIRDQDPLKVGAIAFEAGWDLSRFVEYLNGFAFFWPGDEHKPIEPGRNHFKRYLAMGEALAVVRVPTGALFEHNRARRILFSSVNSGSARTNQGLKQWRGEATFRSAEAFTCPPGEVKEVVVEGAAALPASAEFADSLAGPWRPL